jgi:outer membrane immunogenic protein
MKRILAASSFVIPAMIGGQSLIQDPAVAQGFQTNWSGPSIGVIGTGATGTSTQTDAGVTGATGPTGPTGSTGATGLPADGRYHVNGGLFGGDAAYNWQAGSWVYGIAGDISGGDISGSSGVCGATTTLPHACGTNLNWLGTLRGQVGFAVGPTGNVLPYITGGLAVGNVRGWDSLMPASGSDTRAGWTVGAGLAWMVAPHWSVKFEYLHVDLGSAHLFDVVPGVPETVSFKSDLFRVGVSYQFNVPDPVRAPLWTKAK